MRRLTPKDTAEQKDAEDDHDLTPDFYAITRAFPLPEGPAPRPGASSLAPSGTNPAGYIGFDPAAMERWQAEILERICALEAAHAALQRDPLAALFSHPLLSMGSTGDMPPPVLSNPYVSRVDSAGFGSNASAREADLLAARAAGNPELSLLLALHRSRGPGGPHGYPNPFGM